MGDVDVVVAESVVVVVVGARVEVAVKGERSSQSWSRDLRLKTDLSRWPENHSLTGKRPLQVYTS